MKRSWHIGMPQIVRVSGRSMQPTLVERDLLLLSRIYGPLRPRQLVVAQLPGGRGPGVKRVGIGPEDDPVMRNGGVWLERDNSAAGTDSWLFGAVPSCDIRGVVLARLWPRPTLFRC